jgi:hypothetical protein
MRLVSSENPPLAFLWRAERLWYASTLWGTSDQSAWTSHYGAVLTTSRPKCGVKLGVKRSLNHRTYARDVVTKLQTARSCSGQGYMDSERQESIESLWPTRKEGKVFEHSFNPSRYRQFPLSSQWPSNIVETCE